jgi:hypothetical protein
MMTHNRYTLHLFHHAPSIPQCPIPSSTFKKENAVETALLLGPDRS